MHLQYPKSQEPNFERQMLTIDKKLKLCKIEALGPSIFGSENCLKVLLIIEAECRIHGGYLHNSLNFSVCLNISIIILKLLIKMKLGQGAPAFWF